MSEYGTIKIPEPAYEYHNERRQELGLTWEQYINGQEPDAPEAAVDYSEIETRVERAVENALPEGRR